VQGGPDYTGLYEKLELCGWTFRAPECGSCGEPTSESRSGVCFESAKAGIDFFLAGVEEQRCVAEARCDPDAATEQERLANKELIQGCVLISEVRQRYSALSDQIDWEVKEQKWVQCRIQCIDLLTECMGGEFACLEEQAYECMISDHACYDGCLDEIASDS